VSLVLPCYNEGEHILESIEKILRTLELLKYRFEIILIDDKSTDNTVILIEKIVKKYKGIFFCLHKKNLGRGATVIDGIKKAKAKIVGFIDIDLEVSPHYIPYLVEIIKNNEADIVIGHRYYPFSLLPLSNTIRMIMSKGYAYLIRSILNLPPLDTESGYKFFNKKKILSVSPFVIDKHWFWDTEIISRGIMHKLRVKEVPVLFLRNKDKPSTVKLFSDIIKYITALYKFKQSSLKKQYKDA
jgi:glycosyltransferase involved in cell wall biosynthesis